LVVIEASFGVCENSLIGSQNSPTTGLHVEHAVIVEFCLKKQGPGGFALLKTARRDTAVVETIVSRLIAGFPAWTRTNVVCNIRSPEQLHCSGCSGLRHSSNLGFPIDLGTKDAPVLREFLEPASRFDPS